MDLQTALQEILRQTNNMALATSVENKPNVRVVTFAYDEAHPGVVYFTSFKGNQKTIEFEQNPHVTFQPLPEVPNPVAQIRVQGLVQKSPRGLAEVAPLIIQKTPDFAEVVQQAGPMLEAYEIVFTQAAITVGMEDAQIVTV